jgi:hypothetical protein
MRCPVGVGSGADDAAARHSASRTRLHAQRRTNEGGSSASGEVAPLAAVSARG